ncbi:hypothetical protein METBIDRAFT_228734 [Metschnikowia bicuspidata var. bicuspidata NRRL YB-4993]|uniref:Hyphally-regulated cell wall protein N-terminal domain-containing protein n=1 Tax=Metschnikowia bicuspidata var. bicuspidata NRRL YB-4993 TaxID=869754 RepID=A0A1A0HJN0_9ASCO|nr:hypothetical protein METBIDRAFT_228734 [Metschnikowia bicuspidata var. bicuspidata NRRL YB-4993]OBA24097.1 hypothetical protein METBIDRAFT_228734 [Metschnikowia bicuspidata var. bicuspidata NRRL YB-4993]
MKLGIWAVAVVLSIFHSVALSQEITNHTWQIHPRETNLTDLTVLTDIKYTVINSPSVIVQGTFWNNGSFFVFNNERPIQLQVKGPGFHNFGTISFNSISYVEEASYAIWAGGAFWNSGTIYFDACKTPFEEVPFIISSTRLWYNEGRMIFKKTAGSIGELFAGGRSVKDNSLAITNQGTISLYNTHWGVQTNINGNGCIVVGSGSRLNLDFASGAPRLFT